MRFPTLRWRRKRISSFSCGRLMFSSGIARHCAKEHANYYINNNFTLASVNTAPHATWICRLLRNTCNLPFLQWVSFFFGYFTWMMMTRATWNLKASLYHLINLTLLVRITHTHTRLYIHFFWYRLPSDASFNPNSLWHFNLTRFILKKTKIKHENTGCRTLQ